jgi:hypothetical protein
MGFISNKAYMSTYDGDTVRLIPELLVFKPENCSSKRSWFGEPGVYGDKRTQVLRKLREMIISKN